MFGALNAGKKSTSVATHLERRHLFPFWWDKGLRELTVVLSWGGCRLPCHRTCQARMRVSGFYALVF